MALLEVQDVTGGYSRNKPVLHDVSFSVNPGEMVGLIGLNGAGKSTTMKHILGLLMPYRGVVQVGGVSLAEASDHYRQTMAYVPESPVLFEELTVREHLRFTASAYGLGRAEAERRMGELLAEFQMTEQENKLPVQLSKGMRQKVMIMNAFLVKPKLLLIDEPFLGLDPLGIRSLLELLAKAKTDGSAILISSHILSTIEHYCERFVVLHQGRVLVNGPLASVREACGEPDAPLEEAFIRLVRDGVAT